MDGFGYQSQMMTNDYDREYFFLRKPDAARFPFLFPDEDTQDRDFRFARQAPDSPPLIFTNAWADENKRRRISTVTPKVLFDGTDIAVHTSIYEQLIGLDLPGVYMHPSVYIDDDGVRHALNTQLLDQTPLRDRLLFKMGGAIDAFVICHESLRPLFATEKTGVRLLALADY